MKRRLLNIALLFCSLSSNTLAKNEVMQITQYDTAQQMLHTFGKKTDTSTTFVYEKTKNGNQVIRLEFHVEEFPYNAKYDLGAFEETYQSVLPKIQLDHKNSELDLSHMEAIKQSVAVDIYKVADGKFNTNLVVNIVSDFNATTIPKTNRVIVLANSHEHRKTGAGLSSGFTDLSETNNKQGSEKTVWYYTD